MSRLPWIAEAAVLGSRLLRERAACTCARSTHRASARNRRSLADGHLGAIGRMASVARSGRGVEKR
jgi:hypothetical protein